MSLFPIQVVQFALDEHEDGTSTPLHWAIHIPALSRSSSSSSTSSSSSSDSSTSSFSSILSHSPPPQKRRRGRTYHILPSDTDPSTLAVRMHAGFAPFGASSWRGTATVGFVSSGDLIFVERVLERVSLPSPLPSPPSFFRTTTEISERESHALDSQVWVWNALAALRIRGFRVKESLARSALQVEMARLKEDWEMGYI